MDGVTGVVEQRPVTCEEGQGPVTGEGEERAVTGDEGVDGCDE
jgi:hypothetical protein